MRRTLVIGDYWNVDPMVESWRLVGMTTIWVPAAEYYLALWYNY